MTPQTLGPVSARPPAARPAHRSVWFAVRIGATVALLAVLGGCASPSESRATRDPRPSPEATSSEARSPDVTFETGASLSSDTDISWGDGLMEDADWTSIPSEHPGRWSYVNASGACTAAFRGGVLGDAGSMDDREATDALIEYQSGDDFLGAEMLTDGRFLLYEEGKTGVEHRQFSYTFNEFGYFMAARAFVQADYSVWVIVTCEGQPVGPVAEEVLSKNVIAVNAPQK